MMALSRIRVRARVRVRVVGLGLALELGLGLGLARRCLMALSSAVPSASRGSSDAPAPRSAWVGVRVRD